jgi:hypothetical protein
MPSSAAMTIYQRKPDPFLKVLVSKIELPPAQVCWPCARDMRVALGGATASPSIFSNGCLDSR